MCVCIYNIYIYEFDVESVLIDIKLKKLILYITQLMCLVHIGNKNYEHVWTYRKVGSAKVICMS